MRRHSYFALAFFTAVAFGCSEGTTDVPLDQSGEQHHRKLGPSFSASAVSTYDIVGVGSNFGTSAASEVCASGDVPCTYTEISELAFNLLTVERCGPRTMS